MRYLIISVVLGVSVLMIVLTVCRLIRCRSGWVWWIIATCVSIVGIWLGYSCIAYKVSPRVIVIGFPLGIAIRGKDGNHWMDFPVADQTLLHYTYYTDIVAIVALLLLPILVSSLIFQKKPLRVQPGAAANSHPR